MDPVDRIDRTMPMIGPSGDICEAKETEIFAFGQSLAARAHPRNVMPSDIQTLYLPLHECLLTAEKFAMTLRSKLLLKYAAGWLVTPTEGDCRSARGDPGSPPPPLMMAMSSDQVYRRRLKALASLQGTHTPFPRHACLRGLTDTQGRSFFSKGMFFPWPSSVDSL